MPPSTLRTSTKVVGEFSSRPSSRRSASFVRTEAEGPLPPFPPASAEFAPNAFNSSSQLEYGRLAAIISLEVLFFVWITWSNDVELWRFFSVLFDWMRTLVNL